MSAQDYENEEFENEDYDDAQSQSSFEDEDLTGGAFNTPYSHNMGRNRAVRRAKEMTLPE